MEKRLDSLRQDLQARGLDGFLVPHADEHQGEYLPPHAERLAWLTGFTGSAGMAIVLTHKAALFVDGRYTLQTRTQVSEDLFEPHHLVDDPPDSWLREVAAKGGRIGYDPWLHTPDGVRRFRDACGKAGAELVPVDGNPIDSLWADRPGPPLGRVVPMPEDLAGQSSYDKRQQVAAVLVEGQAQAAVLTGPDSIAWLLNIRGGDVPFSPLPLGFAILHDDGRVALFMDGRKTGGYKPDSDVTLAEPAAFGAALDALHGRRVRLDHASAPEWIRERLMAAGAEAVKGQDPCTLPKACKNPTELDGIRAAHRRDGAALTRFLAWLDDAPVGDVTELSVAAKLESFRADMPGFKGLSFPTIAGSGPNGAIVHYSVSPESDRALQPGELFLLDSGGQYRDGTTDVTRTLAIGAPSAEMKRRFTQVLKGHIALSSARFPEGTTGHQLDVLARQYLWADGVDYDHGTGHGVGHYLNVHEGPQRISKRPGDCALKPGMVVSIEPGYYKTGAYGIRIENLVAVMALDALAGAEKALLGFEPLTLAPIDLSLVEKDLLTPVETAWLAAYHQRVRDELSPLLDAPVRAWLDRCL